MPRYDWRRNTKSLHQSQYNWKLYDLKFDPNLDYPSSAVVSSRCDSIYELDRKNDLSFDVSL
jgi:hypothetical protein